MMFETQTATLAQARDLTRRAAQWLDLIDFRTHAAAGTFSPSMSTYHDMLDPDATDAARLAACRGMHQQVCRRIEAERLEGEATYARQRPVDPYGLRWRTTPDGATLEATASLLSNAIESFECHLDDETV
jgi:pyrroline-5-carboxylate reductase